MTTEEQLDRPETIRGYVYAESRPVRSPLSLTELHELEAAAGLTPDDDRYLRLAGAALQGYAAEMVDTWRGLLGEHPHLARYGAHPDGAPNPQYAAQSHPRFARWVIDACTRPRDQAWLDAQHEIGRRHTSDAKNTTDDADSLTYIPLRYVLAFLGPVLTTSRDFLARSGHPVVDVDRMHAAFTKSVVLHATLWSRAYLGHREQW